MSRRGAWVGLVAKRAALPARHDLPVAHGQSLAVARSVPAHRASNLATSLSDAPPVCRSPVTRSCSRRSRSRSRGPPAEPAQSLRHIRKETGLALLAIGDDVDAVLDRQPNRFVHRLADTIAVELKVDRLAVRPRSHEVEEAGWPGKAAAVRRQDPLRAPLHYPH